MLSRPHNRKLGPLINSFSIPAHSTCPGETETCAGVCYASKHWFVSPHVAEAFERNYENTQSSEFVAQMSADIARMKPQTVRLHVSGDFYDAPYVHKWREIIQRFSATTFFAYTRSWRVKRMRRALHKLARCKNMRLWWSCDRDTHWENGQPPKWKGVRNAYMVKEPDEFVPAYADLVFRVYRGCVEKYVQGVLVCPAENGVKLKEKMTCSQCQMCFLTKDIKNRRRPPGIKSSPVPTKVSSTASKLIASLNG